MTQSDIGIVEKLERKMPGYVGTLCADGRVAYVPDEKQVLVNPDGPEAAAIITEMVEALEDARNNILSVLGVFRDDMPEAGVKLFQEQARQIGIYVAKVRGK